MKRDAATLLEAERSLSIQDVAAMLPDAAPAAELPEPKVLRPFFGQQGGAALQAVPAADWPELEDDEVPEAERLMLRAAALAREGRMGLRVVEGGDD